MRYTDFAFPNRSWRTAAWALFLRAGGWLGWTVSPHRKATGTRPVRPAAAVGLSAARGPALGGAARCPREPAAQPHDKTPDTVLRPSPFSYSLSQEHLAARSPSADRGGYRGQVCPQRPVKAAGTP